LTGGEEIRVPEAEKIYVAGNVKKPGAFQVQDTGENTVLTLLSLAEGPLPFTNKEAYIYRKEASGNKNEIAIPLGKILDRKSPDVQLEANDILYVPDNKGKRATAMTLDRIITFGAGTASGVLIYRH
jgi:polysaccharide export outer membrane protein